MVRRTSSRLAHRQGKKIARQSVVTIALALVGSLLFFFVVMPQLIQLFFRFFGGSDLGLDQQDTVPPQVPTLSPPPEATAEPTITLEGFGEADSTLVVVLNGREEGDTEVGEDGSFSYSLTLDEGENLVALYGVDEAGNKSAAKEFRVTLDTEVPSLAFEDLDDGKQVVLQRNRNLEIRGETEPGSQLTLNDKNVYVRLDGTFSTSFYLSEGDNQLVFKATDKAGNTTERAVTVNFSY